MHNNAGLVTFCFSVHDQIYITIVDTFCFDTQDTQKQTTCSLVVAPSSQARQLPEGSDLLKWKSNQDRTVWQAAPSFLSEVLPYV